VRDTIQDHIEGWDSGLGKDRVAYVTPYAAQVKMLARAPAMGGYPRGLSNFKTLMLVVLVRVGDVKLFYTGSKW
jgi:hypothetical protein